MDNQYLISILQVSLTPVVLISGVGLLVLSMTNRIARPLDRIRFIGKELKTAAPRDQDYYLRQIEILYKRTFLLQKAITSSVITIICASLIILMLFVAAAFTINLILMISVVFVFGIICLICALIFFLMDIQASLDSVQIEMDRLKSNYPELKNEKS